jgi:alkylation response protein AidB-like acyl-CoA dehydrogenase
MLRKSAATLCARFGGPKRHRELANGDGLDRVRWQAIVDAGWLVAALGEGEGGLGQGLAGLALLLKEAGRELVTEPVGPVVAALLSTALVHPRHPLINDLAGGAVVVPALQERAAGIELNHFETRARSFDGGLAVSGRKIALMHGPSAGGFLINAMTADGPVVCYIPADAPGLELSPRRNVDGTAAADLVLNAVAVIADGVIATGAEAQRQSRSMLAVLALSAAAELVGLSEKANEIGLDYLKSRRQFGRPIGSFQALQHAAALNHVDAQMSSALVFSAARALDYEPSTMAGAFAAKAYASEVALSVTKSVIQFHGAMGFTEDCDAHLYLKRAMVLSAGYGNAAAMRQLFHDARNSAEVA